MDPRPEPVRARRNEAAKARFVEAVATMRRTALEAGRALVELDRDGHFVFEGCASIAEFGERLGVSAGETRELLSLGRAVEACPELDERVRAGRVPVRAAALLGRVVCDPSLARTGDDWLGWAERESARDLKRRVDRRIEEAARGGETVVPLTLFLSPKGRDDFGRARTIASRKAARRLTEGETLEAVVDHYLADFDPTRRAAGSRRLPHTSTVPGRYVPRAVERTLRERGGDRCALPFCDHEVFLENAHRHAHAKGGHREADNLVRLCARHHRMLDEGRLRVLGPSDAPTFVDGAGRDLGRRARPATGGGDERGPPTT